MKEKQIFCVSWFKLHCSEALVQFVALGLALAFKLLPTERNLCIRNSFSKTSQLAFCNTSGVFLDFRIEKTAVSVFRGLVIIPPHSPHLSFIIAMKSICPNIASSCEVGASLNPEWELCLVRN